MTLAACHDTSSVQRPGGDGPAVDLAAVDLGQKDGPVMDSAAVDLAPLDQAVADLSLSDAPAPDQARPDVTVKPDAALPGPPTGVCTKDKWCWMNPLPQGNRLRAIWAASATNMFAVGDGGTILHFDGKKWTWMDSTTTKDLYGIWGISANSVCAVGEAGTFLVYNGTKWSGPTTKPTPNTLRAVWGVAPSTFVAVGDKGAIVRFENGSFPGQTSANTNDLYGVWGSSATNIHAVGLSGTLLQYTGSSWKALTSPTQQHLLAVWGHGSSCLYAGGFNGTVATLIGTKSLGTTKSISAIWGSSCSDVHAVSEGGEAFHYGGKKWSGPTKTGTTLPLRAVTGTGLNLAVAVGDHGATAVYGGKTWKTVSSNATVNNLTSVWGSGANDVWAVGAKGTVVRNNGSKWAASSSGTTASLNAIWGSGPTEIHVVGRDSDPKVMDMMAIHYDGIWWKASTTPKISSQNKANALRGVWGDGKGSVFAVGGAYPNSHYILKRGTSVGSWTTVISGGAPIHYFRDIWGRSATDMFIAGYILGDIFRFNGTGITKLAPTKPCTAIWRIWGAGPNSVYFAGYEEKGSTKHSCVLLYNGLTWTKFYPSSLNETMLRGIWGTATGGFYAVGYSGSIFHISGTTATQQASGTRAKLYGVWGNSATDVYVVGENGAILHRGK